jgi:hypothetical protein
VADRTIQPPGPAALRGAGRLCSLTGQVPLPPTQLLLYGFAPDADFEGQLVGALERLESGGSLRILDALFVMRDAETGEFVAVDPKGRGGGGMVASLLEFRLDPAKRRQATERALGADAGGETLRELEKTLEPGAAMAALLVEHVWARALEDAVARTGGTPLASEFIGATALWELASDLLTAARRSGDWAESRPVRPQ